jgi:hypothetical protein
MKDKRPLIAKAILKKKNNAKPFTILDFTLYYRAIIIKKHTFSHTHKKN